MKHEDLFSHATKLASAFIANGDIRLSGNTRSDTEAMAMTRDLIVTLYEQLSGIEKQLNSNRQLG